MPSPASPILSTEGAAAVLAAPPAQATTVTSSSALIRNRRKRYLDLHPEYFSSSLELADPLLYDLLIRRFQSAHEREAEGRAKGYSGVLEADILRSEAKLEALKHANVNQGVEHEVPENREEGVSRWREVMMWRFLEGRDGDFEYERVDGSEDFDDVREEERGAEEVYFAEEEPAWVGEELEGETGVQDF